MEALRLPTAKLPQHFVGNHVQLELFSIPAVVRMVLHRQEAKRALHERRASSRSLW